MHIAIAIVVSLLTGIFIGYMLGIRPGECPHDFLDRPTNDTLELIEMLREHEGATVEICCQNPEPESREDQEQVFVSDDWTQFEPRAFRGETLKEALIAAYNAREQYKLSGQTLVTQMPATYPSETSIGGTLVNRLKQFNPERLMYCFQFLIGSCGMMGYGFTQPHENQKEARWTLDEIERAIGKTERRQSR